MTGIDEMLIARLLEEQAPSLAGLRAVKVRDGWDNAVWRLGDSLAIRITRRAVAAGLHQHEQRWLPVLAPGLPLAVPAPVIAGVPSALFPWPWSVVPWFEGEVAAVAPSHPRETGARGAFLAALHVPAPEDVAPNPARGGPLASCQAAVTMWAEQALKRGGNNRHSACLSAACGVLRRDPIFARGKGYEAIPRGEECPSAPGSFVVARQSDASLWVAVAPF